MYSALDFFDGYYQLVMRASDIPLTAVRTPSIMLWEWLVIPQGLSNSPATFNRLVTQRFGPHRNYAQTYFDGIFVHSRAKQGWSDVENHIGHLRAVLECSAITNCTPTRLDAFSVQRRFLFSAVSLVSASFVRIPLRSKIYWTVRFLRTKYLRKWLGLANYLHKYSENYADMARPSTDLLEMDTD